MFKFKSLGISLLLAIIGISVILSPLQASRTDTKIYYQDQVAVLMYHHIHDQDKSSGTITTALFDNQLKELTERGYQFISLTEFKQFMQGASVPANAVLITFDDGYQSFYTSAYPLLKSRQIPAVNFVITGTLANPLATYIPYMTNEQISEMTHDAESSIDAQCHTDSLHDKLPNGKAKIVGHIEKDGLTETDEAYNQRILQDITTCRDKLSVLGEKPIDSLAYPFGITNKQASKLVHEAGIDYAFTIIPKMATRSSDPLRIPRINAGNPNITPELLHRDIQRRIVARPNKEK
ncbi:polysaccharide deacetylase family protein [Paenibacillus eucommiae]|uniref:Peptidoglycan/xylan/chitin deacetylase (PgdA/CDA1 family) n=1 Tax=Paenibacillus eucommiae TaxID=1355755 RepID=A0ABS4IPJ7_9BACL|nr:polysaccharide deacetylase family protein [Paenibacillus eucommiae]MBP1989484.1 peptidoglycan/xylan/chitin deacetylase (PgdA/CDA1 family) [Paenibacillus eucommiae]